MRTSMLIGMIALGAVACVQSYSVAGTPPQAYHRTPGCIDGNCVPNRSTTGYHATRWRPWPGGEPTDYKPTPQVGVELKTIQVPSRDKELELPFRPSAGGEGTSTSPSPNDRPSGGVVLPPDLNNLTPQRPVEESGPGSSSIRRGPSFPSNGLNSGTEPMHLGKTPEPLRLRTADAPSNDPSTTAPPQLKIRPASNSQSRLMPEMVPWNDEDKNPIIRQTARITSNQVQQTIRLDEAALPDSREQTTTIRVQHLNSPNSLMPTTAVEQLPNTPKTLNQGNMELAESRSTAANAPAILSNIEAQPLPAVSLETMPKGNSIASPLRGVSQGNPLRP
jgi:hypothetical protein